MCACNGIFVNKLWSLALGGCSFIDMVKYYSKAAAVEDARLQQSARRCFLLSC